MTIKQQAISQTGQNKTKNQALKDSDRKVKDNQWVSASTLIFSNISVLKNPQELYALVDHLIKQDGSKDEDVKMTINKKDDTATYEIMRKKLCLDIAHHAKNAFKHHHPLVEIHKPKDNQFYKVMVNFGGQVK